MNKSFLLLTALLLLLTPEAHSEGLESEIKSGDYCQQEIFDKFKLIEKTEHKRLKFKPKKRLLDFAVSMELMCPWSTERDYNGDKKKDWVGYVKLNNEYQLIAYLSGPRSYTLQVINNTTTAPSTNFVRWIQTKYLKNYTKKQLQLGNSRYALQVVDLNGDADFYLWDGKKLAKVLTTPQIF